MKEWGDPLFCLLIVEKQKMSAPGPGKVAAYEPRTKEKRKRGPACLGAGGTLGEGLGPLPVGRAVCQRGSRLRLFIDKEGGVTIDDCVDMTHAVNPVLDREDPISQEYLLEVSSPGLERKLTRPEHFARYLGKPVRARLIRPLETGERELCGILLRAQEDGQLEIQLDEDTSVTLEKKECSSIHSVDEDFTLEETER